VNSKLYVVGGNVSIDQDEEPCGDPAPVEVYDEENNKWSIVEQNHIRFTFTKQFVNIVKHRGHFFRACT